eukprot:2080993-Pyramimonas_sp.AAC.2
MTVIFRGWCDLCAANDVGVVGDPARHAREYKEGGGVSAAATADSAAAGGATVRLRLYWQWDDAAIRCFRTFFRTLPEGVMGSVVAKLTI